VTDRRRLFAVLYYGGLALVLALILLQLLDEVLGARLASHIAHNSEAYLAAWSCPPGSSSCDPG
jgi:hypothetical protein